MLGACSTKAEDIEIAGNIATVSLVASDTAEPATTADDGEDPAYLYREMNDGGFRIPAVDVATMNPHHIRREVDFETTEQPGTIIVDQRARFLYYVKPGGRAIRYAVGVGPMSRSFQGTATIALKRSWPRWVPTANMIRRSPEHYGRFKDGVDGGPGNPLGARALYIYKDGKDTYYRVHGTNAPSSIGKAVSAGCIRLLAQDIIDLYGRVSTGTRIVVR
ncbi:MAG: L,D-transpeptidase [Rhizobium sp.]|nr:MAG: L,D-transpeptidase [Rhizobium sp.]